jgi:hypothetical protein
VFSIPSVGPPAKCSVIKDPVFHTSVSRVSERSQDGYSGAGITNHYSKADYENSDGTRVLLRTTSGVWHLYDATSFKRIKSLGLGSASQPEPRWDAKNPSLLYYLDGMKLMALDVGTNQASTVHDFSSAVPGGSYLTTGVEGDASVDRNRWCFAVRGPGGSLVAFVSYDRPTDSVLGKKTSINSEIDWLGTSMSGKHCVVGWDSSAAQAFSISFSKSVMMPSGATGHADLGLTASGADVFVYQDTDTDYITMANLDTGKKTNLVFIPFNVNSDLGLHFSGNCAKKPGWMLVSTYGQKNPSGSHSWMDHHLFMVELKAAPRVWRVASTYSYMGGYWSEAFASINTAGTRVYWGSNWGQSDLDRIETFVALLPASWPSQVP